MGFSRTFSFMLFRVLIPLVVVGIQLILFRKTERWFKSKAPNARSLRLIVRSLFLVMNVGFLYVFFERPTHQSVVPWWIEVWMYPFYFWHSACFFIGLFLLISNVLRSPFKLGLWVAEKVNPTRDRIRQLKTTTKFQTFDATRRTFMRRSMYGLTAASFGGTAYGMFLEKNECEITSAEFPIARLPEGLDGFTMALVSDIHSSIFMSEEEMEKYARLVNDMNADLIVVPGDFVTSDYREVYPFVEAFHVLSAPCGVYGVLGNHDFYAGPDRVAREVDAAGIKMLRNDKVVIEKNGGKFSLIGVDDVGFSNRAPIKLEEAIGQAPQEMPQILLCHRPYYLDEAADNNIDLVLSGHTHGGQIVLGKFGDVVIAPSSLVSRYVWGKYKERNTHMYVSRGIGTVGLPVRINCPPEITKITLKRA